MFPRDFLLRCAISVRADGGRGKLLIQARGLKQAKIPRCPVATVEKIIRGEPVKPATLLRLSDALEVDFAEFFPELVAFSRTWCETTP